MDDGPKEIERFFSLSNWTISDVVYVMSLLRNLLERNQLLKEKYGVVNLYSNWTLHTQITQSMVGFRMLEKLTNEILTTMHLPLEDEFFRATTAVIGVPKFRSELILLCSDSGIAADVLENDLSWQVFFSILGTHLLERPLKFPEPSKMRPKVRKIYNRIETKPLFVKELCFSTSSATQEVPRLYWKAKVSSTGEDSKTVTFLTPLR